MIFTDGQERKRFLRFMMVGVVGAVVDFGVFNLLASLLGMPGVWAQTISFTAAVISNFVWNRFWTYPDSRSKPIGRQLFQFGVVSFIGLGIRTPLFSYLEPRLIAIFSSFFSEEGWHLPPVLFGHNLALAIGVGVVMLWNFFINRFWTYSDVKLNKSPSPVATDKV
jgi:putative flippase GtrA